MATLAEIANHAQDVTEQADSAVKGWLWDPERPWEWFQLPNNDLPIMAENGNDTTGPWQSDTSAEEPVQSPAT